MTSHIPPVLSAVFLQWALKAIQSLSFIRVFVEAGLCVRVLGCSGCSETRDFFFSVCGVDESPPRRTGCPGCHRLQVRAH